MKRERRSFRRKLRSQVQGVDLRCPAYRRPKKGYFYKGDALEGLGVVQEGSSDTYNVFRCERCGFWHVGRPMKSPKLRLLISLGEMVLEEAA